MHAPLASLPRVRAPASAASRMAGDGVLALGGALALAGVSQRGSSRGPRDRSGATGLFCAAALLAGSVVADSALEHYRGGFRNPGMFAPLLVAGAAFAAAVQGSRGRASPGAPLVFGAALATGAAGLGFHIYNIGKRPGRFSWINLFYAAPVAAPAALSLTGVLGAAACAVARGRRRLLGQGLGRVLTGLAAAGLAGTAAEAGLLHFRGAFQNPFMWLPVTLPPLAAMLLGRAALEREAPARRPLTRALLASTAALGVGGVGFHIFGVSRAMGGWRNWRQNMIDGPPIPAPPAFSALAVAGLAALGLRDTEARR